MAAKYFVDALVNDPANPPEMIVLSGFPGKSSVKGHKRLYLNVALSEHYEIPSDAILHEHKHPAASSPLGVVTMWIRQDAELIRSGTHVAESKARFFAGPIQQSQMTPDSDAKTEVGPTGIENCTQAPDLCGNTAWEGCPKK